MIVRKFAPDSIDSLYYDLQKVGLKRRVDQI